MANPTFDPTAPLTDDQLAEAFEMAEYVEQQRTELQGSIEQGNKKEKKYIEVMNKLTELSMQAKKREMIPVCNGLAYFEGMITNTNRVTVLLGDNWFAERSVDQARGVAKRRLHFIKEEKERMSEELDSLKGKLDYINQATAEAQFDAQMSASSAGKEAASSSTKAKQDISPEEVAEKKKVPLASTPAPMSDSIGERTVNGDATTRTSASATTGRSTAKSTTTAATAAVMDDAQAKVFHQTLGDELMIAGEEEDDDEGLTMEALLELEAEMEAAGMTDLSDEEIDDLIHQKIEQMKKKKKQQQQRVTKVEKHVDPAASEKKSDLEQPQVAAQSEKKVIFVDKKKDGEETTAKEKVEGGQKKDDAPVKKVDQGIVMERTTRSTTAGDRSSANPKKKKSLFMQEEME